MTDEQKVFIRGVAGRGKEVIKMLEDLGAKTTLSHLGENPSYIYVISHEGNINCALYESETGKIIMDNYRELHLPDLWKDGDVLATDDGALMVFRGSIEADPERATIDAYCAVSEHQICLSANLKHIGCLRLATPSEIERFHELMHKNGKDWDAEKKQVVDWQWEPKKNERYYYIDNDSDILCDTWDEFLIDDDRYNFGNVFRTREEAEAALERVKKALKGE